ncbi:MAG: YihA family ribosome biogenesis GTP-binding protein, partial [Syntrophomonadaceae bacterium]|nr:YihA family ribosome biogenesis GTP-binding protein [Syntrophomonadaceae bacterium]
KVKWGKMVEKYLSERQQLRGVIQLVDIRHKPSEDDVLMKEWLTHFNIPILVVATKADKISRGARQKYITVIRKTLDLQAGEMPLYFSAQTGEGVPEVLEAIEELV